MSDGGQGSLFLDSVYRRGGSTFDLVAMTEVGRELGLAEDETRQVVTTLIQEGSIVHVMAGGWISLTAAGVARAKAAQVRRGEPAGRVFISYCHQDVSWLRQLRTYLAPFERMGIVDRWDDQEIPPGAAWRAEIAAAIGSARIAVLLVSGVFLASKFISEQELPLLLDAHRNGRLVILPLLISPSAFEQIPELKGIQAVNRDLKPLNAMKASERQKTLVELASLIEKVLGQRQLGTSPSDP